MYCTAANSTPGQLVTFGSVTAAGWPNPTNTNFGVNFAIQNYVWYALPAAGTNNSRGVLDKYAYIHNIANWNDLGAASHWDYNDGQRLGQSFPITAAMQAVAVANSTNLWCVPIVAFVTDAPIIAFAHPAPQYFSLIVDGQLAFPTPGVSTGGSTGVYVTFVNFGSRKPRQIVYLAANTSSFAGLAIGANDSLSPLDITSSRFVYGYMGESVQATSPCGDLATGPMEKAMALLGSYAGCSSAVGGCGYVGFSGSLPTAADPRRIAMATQGNPDLFMFCGIAINDSGVTAQWTTNVQSAWTQARTILPKAVIVIQGPDCPSGASALRSNGGKFVTCNDAQLSYLQAGVISGPWIYLDNINGNIYTSASPTTPIADGGGGTVTGQYPWITGSGYVGTTSGSGNADFYTRGDGVPGVHPTTAWPSPIGLTTTTSGSNSFVAGAPVTITTAASMADVGGGKWYPSQPVLQAITFTSSTNPTTLTSPATWNQNSGTYLVTFANNECRFCSFTFGSATFSMSGAVLGSAQTAGNVEQPAPAGSLQMPDGAGGYVTGTYQRITSNTTIAGFVPNRTVTVPAGSFIVAQNSAIDYLAYRIANGIRIGIKTLATS